VDEKIYDPFLEKLQARVEAMRMGAADDPALRCGGRRGPKGRGSVGEGLRATRLDRRVRIGGCRADALAREFGTPVMVVSESALRARAREYAGGASLTGRVFGNGRKTGPSGPWQKASMLFDVP
jgi:acyl-CoA reductase-like NAD-dependent aldehyde dehydrogenase